MHVACGKGNVAKVEHLLKAGHPVNVCDGSGFFPIHDATDAGCLKATALLVANGADVNVQNEFNGLTPLMETCKNSHLQDYRAVTRFLLERGKANCDLRDNKGRFALTFLRESRRENERIGAMSSEDLADWMELESLILSKMKKKPKDYKFETTKQQRTSNDSSSSGNLSTNKSRFHVSPNLLGSSSSSSSAESDNESSRKSLKRKSEMDDDAIKLYQSAIGGIKRSAKGSKMKKVLADGNDSDSEVAESTKYKTKKKKSDALKSLVINDPFLEENLMESAEKEWLIDDIGPSKSRVKQTISETQSTSSSKTRRKGKIFEIAEKSNAQNDEELLEACLKATAEKNDVDLSNLLTDVDKAPSPIPQHVISLNDDNDEVIPMISDHSRSSPPISTSFNSNTNSNSNNTRIDLSNRMHETHELTIKVHFDREDYSGEVKRESLLINNSEGIKVWTIEQLRHEAKTRYAAVFGRSPVISSIQLLDRTTLADDSTLAPIAKQHGEVVAVVDRWQLPPLVERYRSALKVIMSEKQQNISKKLEQSLNQAELSGRCDVSHFKLTNSQLHCLFKSLSHQSNLTLLNLSGNCFGVNTDATSKSFSEMLATLPNLNEIDLSLCNLTADDLRLVAQSLDQVQIVKCNLKKLNLSYNPFVLPKNRDQSLTFVDCLYSICMKFSPSLRKLLMASCFIDGNLFSQQERLQFCDSLKKMEHTFEIDLSFNPKLSSGGFLEVFLTHGINFDRISILHLDGLFCKSPAASEAANFGRLLAVLLQSANRLSELGLSSNSLALTDDQIAEFAVHLPRARSLASLDLSGNGKITSKGFAEIAIHLPRCCSLSKLSLDTTGIESPLDITIFDKLADKMDASSGAAVVPLGELKLPEEGKFSQSDISSLKQVLSQRCSLVFN